VPADVREEELEAVGGRDELLGLEVERGGPSAGVLGRLRGGSGRPDLQAEHGELARERLDVLVDEVVLQHESLELGGLDVAALLSSVEQHPRLLAFQQLMDLILRQVGLSSFRTAWIAIDQTF
jgi:hypothetical protein